MLKRIFLVFTALLLCLNFMPKVSVAAPNVNELKTYLASIGMTEKELNDHLEYYYDENIQSFSSIDELKDLIGEPLNEQILQEIVEFYSFKDEADLKAFLVEYGEMDEADTIYDVYHFTNALDEAISFYMGTPITDENLKNLLGDYEMTYDELIQLLEENGDSLDNYEFIEDLEDAILTYSGDMFGDVFSEIFKEIGITDDELEKLLNHLMSIDLDEKAEQRLEKISEQMMAIGDFESESDLTEEQVQEILNAYQEMLSIFQLNTKFYLVKGSEKKTITINELAQLESANGYNLLIELYDLNGNLLADMILTPEVFGSDIIKDTAQKIDKVEKTIIKPHAKPIKKTINGGKLPNTAGHYGDYLLGGFVMILIGILLFRRWRVMKI